MKNRVISNREYNKKRRILLGRDILNKKLYPYDYVLLKNDMETSTSYISPIYWTPIDGAFVNSHPAHIKMGLNYTRGLKSYFESKDYCICKKVSYKEYLDWEENRKK